MADRGRFVEEPECSDLLPCLKRLVCQALSTVDGLDRRKLDSCFLKLNKKLESGDLIIPAFVRTSLADVKEVDKVVGFAFFSTCS